MKENLGTSNKVGGLPLNKLALPGILGAAEAAQKVAGMSVAMARSQKIETSGPDELGI